MLNLMLSHALSMHYLCPIHSPSVPRPCLPSVHPSIPRLFPVRVSRPFARPFTRPFLVRAPPVSPVRSPVHPPSIPRPCLPSVRPSVHPSIPRPCPVRSPFPRPFPRPFPPSMLYPCLGYKAIQKKCCLYFRRARSVEHA